MNSELFKGFFIGLIVMGAIATTAYMIYRQFNLSSDTTEIEATTIQKSVEKISKLMVIEGYFSEVYSYQEKTKVFFNLIPQEKKALIILNAKAQVGYDLKKVEIVIDKNTKEVIIKSIPKEEINISPDLKFYDIQTSTFTSFSKDDLNKVQTDAHDRIVEQIEKSDIKQQARIRLIENLQSIASISNAIGWKMIDKSGSLGELNVVEVQGVLGGK
jgi:hypothetical protein